MDKTNKSVEEINKEWLKLRPKIVKAKGDMCIYCGAKATEYHHIVPRHMGGDNRLENIVPMCADCHAKAHSKHTDKSSHRKYGRKPIEIPDNFDVVADIYLGNHIRLQDALKDTGLTKNTFYRMLKDYKQRKNASSGRTSDSNGLDKVIDAYLDNRITHSEALEVTCLKGRVFNKRLREYRERTGDMRIPRG